MSAMRRSIGLTETKAAPAVFEAQVRAVLDALYGFACALVPPPEADDLTQVACLRALEHWDRFTPGTSFKTWIFTILKHECIDRHRRAQRWSEQRLDAVAPFAGTAEGLEAVLIAQQWDVEVRDALLALPETYRIPVYLKDVAGFAYREIAEIAGCPLGTVMSRLARGRAMLRASLAKQETERGLLRPAVRRMAR
jgi:RNA polymerase sigma-70 factor (ECF subfamily)